MQTTINVARQLVANSTENILTKSQTLLNSTGELLGSVNPADLLQATKEFITTKAFLGLAITAISIPLQQAGLLKLSEKPPTADTPLQEKLLAWSYVAVPLVAGFVGVTLAII